MADERLGASFSIDVTNLKAGLAQANRLIRESESEFKAAAAGMDDWTQSEAGLASRIRSLSSITEIQKAKVSALKTQYQRLIDDGLDPASKQAVDLRIQINNEEAALNKNEAEIRQQTEALRAMSKGMSETSEAAAKTEGGFTIMKGAMANLVAQGITAVIDGCKEAAKALVSLVSDSVSAFASYEQLVGGVDTLFGESSGKVQKYADEAYKTAGMSANDYMETVTGFSASLLQSLGGDTEKAADYADMAIRDMSDNANKMGTDIESIQNAYGGFAKQNFTMLDNLKLGYGGTQEEMKRLLAEASKISGIEYDISSYADIVDAIHVVQNEMGITGTTAKEASSTIEGSLNSMKGAWQNLLVGLGNENADLEGLIDSLVDSISTVLENLVPRITLILGGIVKLIENLIPQIPPIIQEFLPVLIDGVMDLVGGLVGVLPTVVDTIVQVIPEIITALLEMLPTLLQACIEIVINVINSLTKMLPKIVEAIIEVVPLIIESLVKSIPDLLKAAVEFLMAIVDAIPKMLKSLLKMLPSIVRTIINGLLNAIPQLISAALALFNGIIQAIPTIVQALTESLPQIIDTIINGLITALPMVIDGAIQLFMAIIDAIPVIVTMLGEALPQIISAVVDGLVTALPQVLDGAITLLMAIIDAIPQIATVLWDNMPIIISTIIRVLGENMPKIRKAGDELLMGIIKAIPDIVKKIGKNVPEVIKAMVDGLKKGIKDVKSVGSDVVKGLWEGIKDMTKWITDKLSGFGDTVLDGIKNFFGIHSPSTVMRDEIGKNLALGIGEGFADNIGAVNDEITDAMNFEDANVNVNARSGEGGSHGGVVVYQTNNYSAAHSRFELYKSKQQTAAAVRLAMGV